MTPATPLLQPPPRPMVLVALAHLTGLVAGLALVPPAAPAALVALALTAWGGWHWWRARRIHGPPPGAGWALLAAVAALGLWQGTALERGDQRAAATFEPWLTEPAVILDGRVAEPARIHPDRVELLLDRVRLEGRARGAEGAGGLGVLLRVEGAALGELLAAGDGEPLVGQRLRATGWLRPAAAQSNPSSFDAAGYWRGRGAGARMMVETAGRIELAAPPGGPRAWIERPMRRLRAWIGARYDARLGERPAALARALVLGEAHRLDDHERERFRQAGLSHLLAVSGLHTGIILMLLLGAGRALFLPPRAVALLALGGLLFYMALTGFRPPVVRAGVMGGFLLVGFMLGRVATAPASLATAAFATLLLDPRNLLRLDWQLSYVCVLGLVLAAPPIYEWATGSGRRGGGPVEPPAPLRLWVNHWLIAPVVASLAVQLALLPVQAACFREVNALVILSNVAGIHLTVATVTGAVATAALGGLGWLGEGLAWASGMLLEALHATAGGLGHWRPARLDLPVFPPLAVAAYYGLLLSGGWLGGGRGREGELDLTQRRSMSRRLHAAPLLLGLVIVWLPAVDAGHTDWLDLYMLDVGQGDCLVVRCGGRTLVVDAGAGHPADRGRMTVAPFLQSLGVRRIDWLVASHADADHIGGMAALVERFEVGALVEGPDVAGTAAFAELRRAAAERGVPEIAARPGARLGGFEPAEVVLLGPLPGLDNNDASVVMRVELGEVQLLLAGDLELAGEEALLAAGLVDDVEVLKVGHHGSRGSSGAALLAAARPELALISVGAGNRYGHPAPQVLERLAEVGAVALRSDHLGAVWLRTDGRRIEIRRYGGGR